jgi:cation:H+ antiporter
MLILWIIVFVVSLAVLVKGSDWLIESAEKIGLSLGLSPFIVGITIVSIGTSFPELVSSFVAVFQGVSEVVVANVVGSNIANILLVVGISSIISKELIIKKNLIDLDLPLLAISTVLLLGIAWDQQVTFGESVLMVLTYGIYLAYTISHKDIDEIAITRKDVRAGFDRPKLEVRDLFLLILGIIGLVFGAKYLIESLVELSTILNIGTGVIAITAVAVGTSLPELFVSAKAAFNKKSEIALGNILGSNIFNALVVVGLPGLFQVLPVDTQTFHIGLPVMAFATLLFIISGISKRIHMWEGAFYLSLYILFIAKLFNWF